MTACPNCGHVHDPEPAELTALTPLGDRVGQTAQTQSTTTVQSGGGRTGLIVGVLIVAAVVAGLAVALTADDPPSADADQDTPTSAPLDPNLDANGEERIISPPGLPPVDADGRVVIPSASGNAALVASEYRLAYLGADGVVMVSEAEGELTATTLPISDLAPPNVFTDLARFGLLNENRVTYGVTNGPQPTVIELYNRGRLIAGPNETLTMLAEDNAGLTNVWVATALGFADVAKEIPNGSRTLVVPGLGLLVSPPTGQTYQAIPQRLELLSEHLIVASTVTSHVELRCSVELQCDSWLVDRESLEEIELPEAFGRNVGQISVSPDDRWVLLTNSGDDQAVDVTTGVVIPLSDSRKGPVSWAPDATLAVWFDANRLAANVEVFDGGDEPHIASIDLRPFGADAPTSNNVLLF